MIDQDEARARVSRYISENVYLPDEDEFVISLYRETESEWIFGFNSKFHLETHHRRYSFAGPKLVQVDKVTADTHVKVVHVEL